MLKKLIKIGVVLFILFVVALIGAHFYVKSYLNKEETRKMITQEAEKAINRKVTYGAVNYSFLPPALYISDFKVKEANGQDNFVALETLDIKVNLSKKSIEKVILKAPEINVTQNADGSFNFSDLAGSSSSSVEPKDEPQDATTAEDKPEKTPSDSESKPFDLGGANIQLIQIQDAKLKYVIKGKDEASTKTFEIPDFDLDIKDISLEKPIQMDLKIDIGKSSSIQKSFQIGPIGVIPPDLANLKIGLGGSIKLLFKDLEAFIPPEVPMKDLPFQEISIDWKGGGTLDSGFQVDTNIKTPALGSGNQVHLDLAKLLKINIPKPSVNKLISGQVSPDVLQTIDFIFQFKINSIQAALVPGETLNLGCEKMEVNFKEDKISVEKFNFSHKQTALQFNMEAKKLVDAVMKMQMGAQDSAKPEITMNLLSNNIVVDELLKALPSSPASGTTKPESPASSPKVEEKLDTPVSTPAVSEQQELDLRSIPLLKQLYYRGDILINSVSFQKNKVENIEVKVVLKDGVLNLNPLSLDMYDGKIKDTATVNLLDYPISYKMDFAIQDINLHTLLAANMEKPEYYGDFHTDFNIEGKGITIPNIEKYAIARGEVNLKNGKQISQNGSFLDRFILTLDNPALHLALPELGARIAQAKAAMSTSTETVIEDFLFSFNLEGGVVTLTKFQMGTPDYVLTANGKVLPFKASDQLDLKAQMNLSEKTTNELTGGKDKSDQLPYENGGMMIPLKLVGSFNDPKPRPDLNKIIKSLSKGQAKAKISGLLGGKKEEGGESKKGGLGGLLGGGKKDGEKKSGGLGGLLGGSKKGGLGGFLGK